ncbi:MAG: hypothetical protein K2I08_00965, partial [Muribaculaceae bacterium]|nr:hypothetical protein [Muribaculaceae bacterium]
MNSTNKDIKGDDIELRTYDRADAQVANQDDEQEIDLLELAMKLWNQKKKICLWCFIGAILGVVVAFSIPREYTT